MCNLPRRVRTVPTTRAVPAKCIKCHNVLDRARRINAPRVLEVIEATDYRGRTWGEPHLLAAVDLELAPRQMTCDEYWAFYTSLGRL